MEKLDYLCQSANGMQVVYDALNSHTATHFKDNPNLKDLVIELLSGKVIVGDLVAEHVDMGRIIGTSSVVEVQNDDEIVYAMRLQREDQGYVPFVKNRQSEASSLISIYLVRINENTYELSSSWIGEFNSPDFPQMINAGSDSVPYWKKHAFVWGSQGIIPGSERTDCPW
jgi:hypothetical protein